MTEKNCIICHHNLAPTELQTCLRCLARTRTDLARINQLYAYLPGMLGQPDGATLGATHSGHTEPALPGGDILAMLAPGSATGEGHPNDPPAVAFELWTWAEDWAGTRTEPTPTTDLAGWLSLRAGWAADHHPAFDEFTKDLTRILRALEAATATSDAPEHGPVCPYCRVSDLTRPFTDQGLGDEWVCARCMLAFSYPQYLLAVRGVLEDEQARREAAMGGCGA